MKYLCLAYEEEHKLNDLTRNEWDKLRGETLSYVEDLRNRGRLVSAEALQSVRTATTVRVRSSRVSITDGPFAETKEQLGGFFLITARDLNEPLNGPSSLPRSNACNHLCAVLQHQPGMKPSFMAGDSLNQDAGACIC